MANNYPKLHNAAWPGIVGKGTPDSEPIIALDTLLKLTANAEVDGQKFDGIDLFVTAPHFEIDADAGEVRRQKAAYAIAAGDGSSDVCSSGLGGSRGRRGDRVVAFTRRRPEHGFFFFFFFFFSMVLLP